MSSSDSRGEDSKLEGGQSSFTVEDYRRMYRKSARQEMLWGAGFVAVHVVLWLSGVLSFLDLFHSIIFIIGLVVLVGGAWQFYHSRRLSEEDLRGHLDSKEFAKAIERTRTIYTKILLGFLIIDGVCQVIAGDEESIQSAGLVKSSVRNGELWRLLTCATLHVNFMHFWMNSQALLGLGKTIESVAHRAYVTIVFLVSVVFGSVFSTLLMPNATSVGASGGLMGLVGFLAVLGYRRKEILPAGFFRSLIMNICVIGLIGLLGFAIIDNAAHVGGLLAGVACGTILLENSKERRSPKPSKTVGLLGLAALIAIGVVSILSIAMMMK